MSVGIAQTKTLAKIANRVVKKSAAAGGVLDLTQSSDQTRALAATSVEDVWGIGPSYAQQLRREGVTTALNLRDADRRWVRGRTSVVGARIVEELRGRDLKRPRRLRPALAAAFWSSAVGLLAQVDERH